MTRNWHMTDISTFQKTLRSSKMGVSGLSCCLYFYCLTMNCQKRRGLWWGTTEKKEIVRRRKRPCAINLSKLLPEEKHFKTFSGTKNRCRTSINIVYTPCTSTQNRFPLIRVFSLGQRFNKWVRHVIQFHRDNSCKLISSFLDPLFFLQMFVRSVLLSPGVSLFVAAPHADTLRTSATQLLSFVVQRVSFTHSLGSIKGGLRYVLLVLVFFSVYRSFSENASNTL